MKMLSVAFLLLVFAGCQRSSESRFIGSGEADGVVQMEDMEAAPASQQTVLTSATVSASSSPPAQQVEPKLIKTADVGMEVEDYAEARQEVSRVAEQHEAYVAAEQERRGPNRIDNTLMLRVPSAQFDALLDGLVEIAEHVDYRTVNVRDVTEEFVDVSARLRARHAVEARYLDLLNQAQTVEDLLRVERSLQTVREEIESAEGRLNYLNDRISFSTVNVNLYEIAEDGVLASAPGFFGKAADAFANGWDGVVIFVLMLINLWPALLLAALAVLALRAYRQRRIVRAEAP